MTRSTHRRKWEFVGNRYMAAWRKNGCRIKKHGIYKCNCGAIKRGNPARVVGLDSSKKF